ncbi:hypothetical protein MBLNU457_g0415t3 [Dothideomycetes sp. NU457]
MASVEAEQTGVGAEIQPTSRLLRMPKEILNEICRMVVADPPQTFRFNAHSTDFIQPGITQVCQVLRKIALPMFYGQTTIELRIDFSEADPILTRHVVGHTRTDKEHVFTKWLRAVRAEIGTLLRHVSLLSTNSVTDQPANLHKDMVWEEQNSRCLAMFLVSHSVDSTFITHSEDPNGISTNRTDLTSFKKHMDFAASLKTMWQIMPTETIFFAKTIAEESIPVVERELPTLKASFESTALAMHSAGRICLEKHKIVKEAMRRRCNELGGDAPLDYVELYDELCQREPRMSYDSRPEWLRLHYESEDLIMKYWYARDSHEKSERKPPLLNEYRLWLMKLLASF